jgi:hypothetical protein
VLFNKPMEWTERQLKNASKMQTELGIGPGASKIVIARFDYPTLSQLELAKKVGVSQPRIHAVLNHPKVIKAFPVLAHKRISGMMPKAVKKYEQLMDQTQNLEVSRKVTERVLESSKVLDSDPKVQVNIFQNMSNTDLKKYLQRDTTQMDTSEGPVIDAEIVEEDNKNNA